MMNQGCLLLLTVSMILKLCIKATLWTPKDITEYFRFLKEMRSHSTSFDGAIFLQNWIFCGFYDKKPVTYENQCGRGNESVMANLIPKSEKLCSANRYTHTTQ